MLNNGNFQVLGQTYKFKQKSFGWFREWEDSKEAEGKAYLS